MKPIEILHDDANDLFLPDSQLEKLATGAKWSEGVFYVAGLDMAVWSDTKQDKLVAYQPDKGIFDYQQPSYYSNGHSIDLQGRIINCEHGRRCISRTVFGGDTQILVDKFDGKRLNSPNDVIVKSDGTIWFTDPRYGILSNEEGHQAESEIGSDNVYRFDPETQALTCVVDDTIRPNGLAFSPDETLLYVSDTSASDDPNGRHEIRIYPVNDDGKTLGKGKVFVEVSPGVPDGFRLDKKGNLFVSSEDSVQIFNPNGVCIAKIPVPETVANMTFGGENFDELYIVASHSLYRIRLNTQGDIQRNVDISHYNIKYKE